MKNILVPCDFSRPAIDAFKFALDIAERSGGAISLVHIVELPVLHDTLLMPALNFEERLLEELRDKATKQFNELIKKYNRKNIDVSSSVGFGSVSKQLLDIINAKSIDLVVVGSHGATGFREYFIGSNAEKIIRKSPVPVLVAKHYTSSPIKDIVFPNTLETEDQTELIAHVKALQSFFNAHLHLVWINTPLNFTSDVVTLQRAQEFAKRFGLKNFSVHIFNHPNEEEGIIHFARLIKAELIAMGTHGRSGIPHVINGSVAEDVANHSDCLLWTYTLKNEPVAS